MCFVDGVTSPRAFVAAQTIAGAVATATHGSTLMDGSMSNQVRLQRQPPAHDALFIIPKELVDPGGPRDPCTPCGGAALWAASIMAEENSMHGISSIEIYKDTLAISWCTVHHPNHGIMGHLMSSHSFIHYTPSYPQIRCVAADILWQTSSVPRLGISSPM